MNILTNVLALIVVLSVLVVVHEFGHFAVAKFFGFPGRGLLGRVRQAPVRKQVARNRLPRLGHPARRLRPRHRPRAGRVDGHRGDLAGGAARSASAGSGRSCSSPGPLMNLALAFFLHTTVFAVGTRVPAYELESPVVRVVEAGFAGRRGRVPARRPRRRRSTAVQTPALARRPLHLRDERPRAPRRRGRSRRHRPIGLRGDAPAEHEVRPRLRGAPAGFRRQRPRPDRPGRGRLARGARRA